MKPGSIKTKSKEIAVNGNSGMQAQLRLSFINDLEELESYARAWNDLAYRAEQKSPMLSYAWISTYLEYRLRPEESWICILAEDHSHLIGVWPLIISHQNILGLKRSRLTTPFDWHTVSIDILVEPGRENDVIPLMLSGLNNLHPPVSQIRMKLLRENSPIYAAAPKGIDGYISSRQLSGYGSFLKVAGGYCQYLAGVDAKFVRNLRRVERKIISLGDMSYSHVTENVGSDGYFDRFMRVEASGWKGKSGTAIAQSPSLTRFYSDLTKKLGQAGWLEWHFLALNGKDIAAMMVLPFGRKLIILKIGYDEASSSLSPGSKIFEFMLRDAYESGRYDEIDCLTKYDWNANWKMESRAYHDLSIYPARGLVGRIPYLYEKFVGFCARRSIIRNLFRKGRNNNY